MKHSDSRAQNLFSRLSRYVPSEGEKRKRVPLEDFCTEALAFCLIKSASFRMGFMEKTAKILQTPIDPDTPILVNTQYSIDNGRVDLAIEAVSGKQSKPWYIEVKLSAYLRESQKRYANVVLAPNAYISDLPKLTWESVFGLILSCINKENSEQETPEAQFILRQFANFLEEKGLKHIIMKTDAFAIHDITSTASLLNEWTGLLNSLRSGLGLKKNRTKPLPVWDESESPNDPSFYGIYGTNDSYAGFEITPNGEIFCYYQETYVGAEPPSHESYQVDVDEQGVVWITANGNYPHGNHDKFEEIQDLFLKLQVDLRTFASKNSLKRHGSEPNVDE